MDKKEWYKNNLDKIRKYKKIYRKKHPEKIKFWRKKYNLKKHGIDISIGMEKPSICKICNRTGKICFDHDHKTGKFRGWICYKCNLTLGLVNDNKEILFKIIKYLHNN